MIIQKGILTKSPKKLSGGKKGSENTTYKKKCKNKEMEEKGTREKGALKSENPHYYWNKKIEKLCPL